MIALLLLVSLSFTLAVTRGLLTFALHLMTLPTARPTRMANRAQMAVDDGRS